MGLLLAVLLTACGGGGGSAGTTNGGAAGTGASTTSTTSSSTAVVTTTATVAVPTLLLAIVDASGTVVTTNSISSSGALFARVIVKDAAGALVVSKLVTFSTDATVAVLDQSAALTNLTGLAKVQISPYSLTSSRAATLVAYANVNGVAIQTSLDFQTAASNVSLANFIVGTSPISALQSSAVTVQGLVNNVLATASPVGVSFSASCGSFSPANASTNSSGVASTTYQSTVACAGAVILSAQATGATAITSSIAVTAAAPANIVYSSATNNLLVVSSATNGNRQSRITFQVLDSAGAGMSGVPVNIYLESAAIGAGVTFSVGGVPTTATQTVSSLSNGFASVTVSSGSLPTPLIVTAALVSDAAIKASSSGVSVTSGKPTQNAASLSASKLSIEGFSRDGVQTQITMRIADRQGNPIPANAVVNFVTGFGLVTGSCLTDATSSCTVTYQSQGTIRGFNNSGRVAILAYMDGEESFTDQNGDNIWQPTEPFFDMGTVYRDDNEDSLYNLATEQTYPGGATGTVSCAANPNSFPSVANTCDGTWSSSIRVRKQIVIVLSTDRAVITQVSPLRTPGRLNISVADTNGNSMAAGTTVAAAVNTSGSACSVISVSPAIVPNTTVPTNHVIVLNGDTSCGTASVLVTVTSTGGLATVSSF